MNNQEYITLVYKNLKGEITTSEFSTLNIETAKNSELAKMRLELEDAWDITGEEKTVVSQKDTDRLLASITNNAQPAVAKPTAKIFTLKKFISSIAAISIAVFGVLWLMNNQTTVYDSAGQYTLADDTKVNLRPGSKLTITSYTDEVRNVTLSGEAFFDVTRDEQRPFIVDGGHVKIEVLGTSFLVKQSDNNTYVNLIEGKVKTTDDRTNEYFVLSPGQTVQHSPTGNIKEVTHYTNLSSWKDEFYQFQNTTLVKVAEELSIIHNVNIEITNQEVAECKFSGSLAGANVEKLLEIVADQYKADIKQDGNKWIINGGQCK